MIYEKGLKRRYPTSTRLYNTFALFLKKRGKGDQMLHFLARSALVFLQHPTEQSEAVMHSEDTSSPLSNDLISVVKNVFHALLKLPSAPVELTPEGNSHCNATHVVGSQLQNDFFCWSSYLLFVSATSNEEDQKEAFENALDRLRDTQQRKDIWLRYLELKKASKATEAELIELVNRILRETPALVDTAITLEQKQLGFFSDPRMKFVRQRQKIASMKKVTL